jgi:rod shape-determining protein MreC
VRDRRTLIVIVLGTFFLVVFNLPSSVSAFLRGLFREGLATYQGAATRAVSGIQRTSSAMGSITDVVRERDRLERENAVLRGQVRTLDSLSRENQELRALLGFRERVGLRTLACEVIARDDGYGWWQTVRLDKGRSAGVREDMPVVTPAGLVGRTTEVSENSCDVLLISDRNFRVSVRFEPEGSFGVMHGGGVSLQGVHALDVLCPPASGEVEFVRKDLTIKTGETVMTSGLGGIFPAGLVVGRVKRAFVDAGGLYQHAEVLPSADLARLRYVLVVTGR